MSKNLTDDRLKLKLLELTNIKSALQDCNESPKLQTQNICYAQGIQVDLRGSLGGFIAFNRGTLFATRELCLQEDYDQKTTKEI